MKRFRAIIFDMDGVIVDSEPRHERAFREVFEEMGYGETHGIDFPQYYGRSDRTLWVDFIAKHQPAQSLEELSEWKQKRFLEMIRQEQPIFENLPELVERLSLVYKLGLASGSYHPVIAVILSLKELRRFFPVVVSVQDVQHGKPAPDVFLRAAELLEVPPSDCCVIEDSAAGVEAAIAAGMTVIGITNSIPREKLSRAHYVVSTYQEIDNLLLGKATMQV
ncbi:MAG TPA: HAD family phosphatase [Candidatus Kapabacteria bacterium]|nr:HAD family phosphatase [Candidatus Kapabacteria bacterium]